MKNYDENLEKILTAVFGAIGIIAILVNLHLKGYGSENFLEALKDISGLIVVIAVFLIANRIFKKAKQLKEFYDKVEYRVDKWASDNKYLIRQDRGSTYKGKVYEMICDLSKFGEEEAENSKRRKGAFLYLPSKEIFNKEKKIQIKINKSLFKNKFGDDYEKYQDFIRTNISDKIKYIFNEYKVKTEFSEDEKIDIIFKEMPETDESAERIIAVIEFTKTMLLALA